MKKTMIAIIFSVLCIYMIIPITVNGVAINDHEVTFNLNGGEYVHEDLLDIGSKINAAAEPVVMFVQGDSTSVGTGQWFYKSLVLLGTEAPDYSIQYRFWDTVTSSYTTNSQVQVGTDGDAYASLDGEVGTYISAPDDDSLSIVGDLDIRVKLQFNSDSSGILVSKWRNAGNQSYMFAYSPLTGGQSSQLAFHWSQNGSSMISTSSSVYSSSVKQDTDIWVRVTLDVDNGSGGNDVMFYYSTNGITYTQIGTTITTAGVTSIFDSACNIELAGRTDGGTGNIDGRIYQAEIRNGINGKVVASPDLGMAFPSTVTSFSDVEGNIWSTHGGVTVGNGSPSIFGISSAISGATTEIFSNVLVEQQMTIEPDILFINFGHNEDINTSYADEIESFSENDLLMYPDMHIVLMTQNPQTDPRTADQILAQSIRMDQIKLVASRNNFVLLDAYDTFASDVSTYVSADGVHPTTAGYEIWADIISDVLISGMTGDGPSTFTLFVEDGVVIVEPTGPSMLGYTFFGWYRNTNNDLGDNYKWDFINDQLSSDQILYAKYITTGADVYQVTFVTNGGTLMSPMLIEDGFTIPAVSAPARLSFYFAGWYIDPELTNLFYSADIITEDVTLYAKWSTTSGGGIVVPEESVLTTTQIIILSVLGVVAVGVVSLPSKKKVGSRR